ncbi:helix-turn-helix domain-containing protein [Enterococcus sp. LJL120]
MELTQILKVRDFELMRLLEYLEQQDGAVKKKDVCEALDISTKSLRNLIQMIQEDFSGDIICVNQLQELQVLYQPDSSFLALKQKIFQHSVSHQILLAMLLDPKLTIEKLNQQLFLSTSSINRRLTKLRGLLADYKLSLKHLKIVGPELQIRLFYLAYFEEIYSPTATIFPHNQQVVNFRQGIADLYERQDKMKLSTYNQYRLELILYISYYRSFFQQKEEQDYQELVDLPYPEHSPYLRKILLANKDKFPAKLMTQHELGLLLQFAFCLPLVSHDGRLYQKFVRHQSHKDTLLYQVYQYSLKILAPLFQTVTDIDYRKRLHNMLFSILNTGLLFSSKLTVQNNIEGTLEDIRDNGALPLMKFLTVSIHQINQFVASKGLHPINLLYLREKLGILIFQADMYTNTQIKVGLFFGRDIYYAQVSFDFLKSRLKINPGLQFYNLLQEEHACDYLVTNDALFAEENRHKFKDCFIIDIQNTMPDTEKICEWLYEILIEEHNKRYLALGYGEM